jgi:hypothetical protein
MPIPIHIPEQPDAIYLAVLLLLAAAVSLVIATRAVAIAHVDPVKFTVPAYVGLMATIAVAGAFFDPQALRRAMANDDLVLSVVLGLAGVPAAWAIDRTIVRRLGRARASAGATVRTAASRTTAPSSPLAPILWAGAPLTIAGGALEELRYRYLVIGLVAGATASVLLAAIVATISYALIHAGFGWTQVLAKAALGLLFLALLVLGGGLIAPMLAHAGFNALAVRSLQRPPAARPVTIARG